MLSFYIYLSDNKLNIVCEAVRNTNFEENNSNNVYSAPKVN